MSTVRLEIVTPERIVYSDDVTMVVAKGVEGDLGILPNHMPLVTPLKISLVKVYQGEAIRWIAVSGGFMEVSGEKVAILAEAAELPEEIDLERAMAAKARAEERLQEANREKIDFLRAELALQRALVRIEAKQKR
jgi:F-type H+-transporting ATPase subunit epsilon